MAINETNVFFEGFLQKRKDTLRLRWATYWFRLQNATLFFYTRKNGNALNLRGNYYIYKVQSVREVHKANSKHFLFEINMNNGKRKLLAAETAELRQLWVVHLWQAMHLSTSRVTTSRSTQQKECDQQQTEESDVMESPPPQPLPAPPDHAQYHVWNLRSPTNLPEAHICRNIPPICDYHGECEDRTEMESLYDVPLSNRKAAIHPVDTENIYDIPSALLRRIPDHTLAFSSEEQRPEEAQWRI